MQSIVSAIAKNNCCLMITLWSVPVTSAAYEDGMVFSQLILEWLGLSFGLQNKFRKFVLNKSTI